MNKLAIVLLCICLTLSNVQAWRMVNKDNKEKAIELFLKFAETYFSKYGTLNLKNMSELSHFGDLKYQNLNGSLTPQDPAEEETSIYEGKLTVEGLSFSIENRYLSMDGKDEKVDINIPLLEITFLFYSNNSFISIDDAKINSENELYSDHLRTIVQLFNMATIKNLKPIYYALKEEQINVESFVPEWLSVFE